MGISIVDLPFYPDASKEYLAAFQSMINIATNRTSRDQISIVTPLIDLDKAQTIQLGNSLGVDYSKTISCYRPSQQGRACGTCLSCTLRKEGFNKAGIVDPTNYYSMSS